MRPASAVCSIALASVALSAALAAQEPCELEALRLDQLQLLGTHNSYHLAPRAPVVRLLPDARRSWSYEHPSLRVQLESLGVRQFELDLWCDPEGGRYARPAALAGSEREHIESLDQPGIKVLHVPDIDFETNCGSLSACLQEIQAWSSAHPGHLPIMVLLELKDARYSGPLGLQTTAPHAWDGAQLDALDAELRAVFPPEQLIVPDDVRGEAESLEQAVLAGGWPRLAAARGRVLFCMDNSGPLRALYRADRPALQGRVLCTNSTPGSPDAAFVKLNDPLSEGARIAELVARGYLVRTRADVGGVEARANDVERREIALASGAQFISSDYPRVDPATGTDYVVRLPGGGVGRVNPVSAPDACQAALHEPPVAARDAD